MPPISSGINAVVIIDGSWRRETRDEKEGE
jgi:hypothetical protein